MKFQKQLAREARSLTNERFRQSLIRYKTLKKHIHQMKINWKFDLHPVLDEECSICFEPFSLACRVITTSCGHIFHPVCLIEALGTGSCTSCPLCRRSAAGLVPEGRDGDCLRFLAMLKINANAVESCHEDCMSAVEAHLATLQRTLEDRWLPFFPNERRRITQELGNLLNLVKGLKTFDDLNWEGFRKIVKKFDKHTGFKVSAEIGARLQGFRFIKDSSISGNGRIMHLRSQLESLLRMVS